MQITQQPAPCASQPGPVIYSQAPLDRIITDLLRLPVGSQIEQSCRALAWTHDHTGAHPIQWKHHGP